MSQGTTTFPDLADEVEIPKQGTLSRVLHSDDRLRVVIFAFDTGQELTEHTAAVPAVIQVVSGRLEAMLGDETVEVIPRSWVHMPAHLPHSLRAVEPTIMLLTMLRS